MSKVPITVFSLVSTVSVLPSDTHNHVKTTTTHGEYSTDTHDALCLHLCCAYCDIGSTIVTGISVTDKYNNMNVLKSQVNRYLLGKKAQSQTASTLYIKRAAVTYILYVIFLNHVRNKYGSK